MSNPDRTLLDQINDAWDARNQGTARGPVPDAAGFDETIEALHQANAGAQPSSEFRARLRQQLLFEHVDPGSPEGDFSFSAGGNQPSPLPLRTNRNGDDDMNRRRWWFSHAGELAAIVLILVVAAVGVALWQSEDSPLQPGATGDDSDDQVEPIPTPEQIEPGVWTNLTIEEAQSVTPFTLLIPDPLPEGYELENITVRNLTAMAEADNHDMGTREDGDPWTTVVLKFRSGLGNDSLIELAQYNLRLGNMPDQLGQPVETSEYDGRSGSPNKYIVDGLEIDGIDVMHALFEVSGRGTPGMNMYRWFQDNLTMHLNTPGYDQVSENDVMAMLESLITQRRTDEEPPVPEGLDGPWADDHADEVEDQSIVDQHELHRNLSIDEAREIVPFPIIDPTNAHEDYELSGVSVTEPPTGEMYHVSFSLVHRESDGRRFNIYQQNAYMASPDISPDSAMISEDGEPVDAVEIPDPEQVEIEIDDLPVTKTTVYNLDGDQITFYTWHQDETSVSTSAFTEIEEENIPERDPEIVVPADDLRAVVTAVVEARQSDEAPSETMVPEPPKDQPPVAEGGHTGVSLNEAQERVPFDLIDTGLFPGELRFGTAELSRSEDGEAVSEDHPEIDEPNRVHLYYFGPPDADPRYILEIVQTTDMIPNPEGEMLEIAGHPVEYVAGPIGTVFQAGWIWEVDGIEYGMLVTVVDQVDSESQEELEAAMPLTEVEVAPVIESTLQ